jgi:hypothetical protein
MKIKWTGYVSRGRRENTNLHALGKPEDGLRILNVEWLGFDVWTVAVERGNVPSSSVKSVEYTVIITITIRKLSIQVYR